jgi:hypothetical protein
MTWRAFVAVMALAFAAAAPALADLNAQPSIAGDPVVGSELSAIVSWDGQAISYSWERCTSGSDDDDDEDGGSSCPAIAGATGPTYTPTTADVDHTIALSVTVVDSSGTDSDTSEPTEPVRPAPPPSPSPPPAPSPSPSPSPQPSPSPRPSTSGGTPAARPQLAAAAPAVRYLRPFPVVRIKGTLYDGGALVTLLRVTAPLTSKVRVSCAGASCPVKRLGRRAGRLRAFERFLAAGTRIVIRVSRPGLVGKHVRIRIRDGKRPARRDSCVLPGSARAAPCPQP